MQIHADDIAVFKFESSDGTPSAAIKVVHRPTGKEAVNHSTVSQRHNLRFAVSDLVLAMNPTPDVISKPKLALFDKVRIHIAHAVHHGEVVDLSWDFTRKEWQYFVHCIQDKVSNRYVVEDLELIDE